MIKDFFWKFMSLLVLVIIINIVIFSFYSPQQKLLFPNSDFEMGDLTNWKAENAAFLNQPTFGDNPIYRGRTTALPQGKYWIGTYEDRNNPSQPRGRVQGDIPFGKLISRNFIIQKNKISFLIGGGDGNSNENVCLEVEGQEVLCESGNGVSSDSEKMNRIAWDVSQWKGKTTRIIIKDGASTNWGHINADDFQYISSMI